jgi:hypothetical protein
VEHVPHLDRPFPWRAAALALCALALAELAALLALAGIRVLDVHHAATPTHAGTAPAGTTPAKAVARPLRSRSRVSVLVLNGNGVPHAAGDEAAQLLGRGYGHALASDAATRYASSLVLFRPGWDGEARRLARDAGIRTVTPLDGRLQAADRRYPIVLILGSN